MSRFLSSLLLLAIVAISGALCTTSDADPVTTPCQNSEFISKVLEFHRIFNLPGEPHESNTASSVSSPKDQLFNFIQKEFSIHAELFNSVWGTERYLFGMDEIRRLFSLWKRNFSKNFHESMQVNHVVQSGNVVTVYLTLVIHSEKSQRVQLEGIGMYYFDQMHKIHRVFYAWDHHQMLLQMGISKIKNPAVEHIFAGASKAEMPAVPMTSASSSRRRDELTEIIMQYIDLRNNRDPEDIKEFHSNLFSKKVPITFAASAFGPNRYLTDHNKVKEYLTGENFINIPGSIHSVNDIFESDNHVILRYTRVVGVKSDRKDKYDDNNQRNCPLRESGYKCMHIEGVTWSTFHPESNQLTRVFTAQDNFRILREQGVLKDVMDETSWIYDYNYAKQLVDKRENSRVWKHDEM